jgi:hypothetical protein
MQRATGGRSPFCPGRPLFIGHCLVSAVSRDVSAERVPESWWRHGAHVEQTSGCCGWCSKAQTKQLMSAVQALEAIETRIVDAVEASAAVAELLSTATAPGVEAQAEKRKLLELCNQVLTNAKVRG